LLDVNGQSVHHPFDGDGMIVQIAIDQGRAYFRNRYVRTPGYVAEQAAGKILYRGVFGTQKPGGWLANIFDLNFKNIANTGVLHWGQKLWALWEAAEPYRLDPHSLDTLGLDNLDGLLKPGDPFSAHPRIDPGSDHSGGQRRLVNFAVKPGLSTRITVYEFDESGQLVQETSRKIPGFAFLHDFVVTPNYYIFFQNPVRYNPLPFVLGMRGAGQCLMSQSDQPTQVILMPRNPEQPVRTIATDPCFVFHHANAFEAEGKVYVDSLCYDFFPLVGPNTSYLDIDFDDYPPGRLWRFQLDLEAGTAQRHCLESRCCEFPSLHPDYVGQDARYLYLGATHHDTGHAPLQAVLKVDVGSGERKLHSFAPRGFAGEPIFVPRSGSTVEDDGWVLVLIYNAARHCSDLVILEAQALEPAATLHLNQHIPYGLHGCFVPQYFGPTDTP
jgi:all-trans-8'-apo-beta-carotenal 15,15'-oxygenase